MKAVKPQRLWGLALIVTTLLIGARPAAAQGAAVPAVQQMRVQVLPEYDDPRVLVIVQGRFATTDTTFPASVTFRVPRGAQINQMAVMDVASGANTPQPYDTRPDPLDPQWTLATYTLSNPHFFYEYYYNPIEGSPDKHFAFVFNSVHPIDDLQLEFQQPLKATNFTLDPPAVSAQQDDSSGFTYHVYSWGRLAADTPATWQIRYTKSDPNPSLTREQARAQQDAAPEQALPGAPAGTTASLTATPAALAPLAGGAVLLAVAGFAWRRRSLARGGQTGYCFHCGARLQADARFCHACGTPARTLEEEDEEDDPAAG